MRITLIVVTCLATLFATGMGLLVASENLDANNQQKLKDAQAMLAGAADLSKKLGVKNDAELGQAQSLIRQAEGYKTSGVAGVIIALFAAAVLVTVFLKKKLPVMVASLATVLVTLLFTVLAPSFETAKYGPASPRAQVLIFGIAGIIAAAAALGAETIRRRRSDSASHA